MEKLTSGTLSWWVAVMVILPMMVYIYGKSNIPISVDESSLIPHGFPTELKSWNCHKIPYRNEAYSDPNVDFAWVRTCSQDKSVPITVFNQEANLALSVYLEFAKNLT